MKPPKNTREKKVSAQNVNSPYELLKTIPVGLVIFVLLVSIGILLLLIRNIGKGRNWARMVLLVLFILDVPFYVSSLQSLSVNLSPTFLIIGKGLLQLIAIVFLFQGDSSQWFQEIKSIEDAKKSESKPIPMYILILLPIGIFLLFILLLYWLN